MILIQQRSNKYEEGEVVGGGGRTPTGQRSMGGACAAHVVGVQAGCCSHADCHPSNEGCRVIIVFFVRDVVSGSVHRAGSGGCRRGFVHIGRGGRRCSRRRRDIGDARRCCRRVWLKPGCGSHTVPLCDMLRARGLFRVQCRRGLVRHRLRLAYEHELFDDDRLPRGRVRRLVELLCDVGHLVERVASGCRSAIERASGGVDKRGGAKRCNSRHGCQCAQERGEQKVYTLGHIFA
jgi:hypothetical protein